MVHVQTPSVRCCLFDPGIAIRGYTSVTKITLMYPLALNTVFLPTKHMKMLSLFKSWKVFVQNAIEHHPSSGRDAIVHTKQIQCLEPANHVQSNRPPFNQVRRSTISRPSAEIYAHHLQLHTCFGKSRRLMLRSVQHPWF